MTSGSTHGRPRCHRGETSPYLDGVVPKRRCWVRLELSWPKWCNGTAFGAHQCPRGDVSGHRGKGTARSAKFAAVRMTAPSAESFIQIDLAGGCVRVRGIVDAQMLREVLAAAR
jgi:hypothetical protein